MILFTDIKNLKQSFADRVEVTIDNTQMYYRIPYKFLRKTRTHQVKLVIPDKYYLDIYKKPQTLHKRVEAIELKYLYPASQKLF